MDKNPKLTSNRLDELIKLNLLNREVMADKYRTVEYSLTEKGMQITKLIAQILEIIQK